MAQMPVEKLGFIFNENSEMGKSNNLNLDSIIYIWQIANSCNCNYPIIFDCIGLTYNGTHTQIKLKNKQEFAIVNETLVWLSEYNLANIRILKLEEGIILDRITSKGNQFFNKARILKAISDKNSSQTNVAETLKLKEHTINVYLEQLLNADFIQANKSYSIKTGELEYVYCALTSKGKATIDDPSFFVENNTITKNMNQTHSGNGDNVADNTTNNTFNAPVGAVGSTFHDQSQAIGQYNEAPSKDLTEAASEIQSILDQLNQTYPNKRNIKIANEAVDIIEQNPSLIQKLLSAAKSGTLAALDSLLSHPASSFVIAAIDDLQGD